MSIRTADSTGILKLHEQISTLSSEIGRLKTEILLAAGKSSAAEVETNEIKAYSELRDESMSRIMTNSITEDWNTIVTHFKDINRQVVDRFPDQEELVFEIEKIDFPSNTSKIALQNLTLMQLHLKLLKLI